MMRKQKKKLNLVIFEIIIVFVIISGCGDRKIQNQEAYEATISGQGTEERNKKETTEMWDNGIFPSEGDLENQTEKEEISKINTTESPTEAVVETEITENNESDGNTASEPENEKNFSKWEENQNGSNVQDSTQETQGDKEGALDHLVTPPDEL